MRALLGVHPHQPPPPLPPGYVPPPPPPPSQPQRWGPVYSVAVALMSGAVIFLAILVLGIAARLGRQRRRLGRMRSSEGGAAATTAGSAARPGGGVIIVSPEYGTGGGGLPRARGFFGPGAGVPSGGGYVRDGGAMGRAVLMPGEETATFVARPSSPLRYFPAEDSKEAANALHAWPAATWRDRGPPPEPHATPSAEGPPQQDPPLPGGQAPDPRPQGEESCLPPHGGELAPAAAAQEAPSAAAGRHLVAPLAPEVARSSEDPGAGGEPAGSGAAPAGES